jgi:hypothetical protein
MRRNLIALAACGILALSAVPAAQSVHKAPPPAPYKQEGQRAGEASRLHIRDGALYVDAKTLPDGPFLAYDHKGELVSTIYMVPLKGMDGHKNIADLAAPM